MKKIFSDSDYYTTAVTGNEKGTGLGLISVKKFLEENNGTLKIESEINKGSCLSFTLPIKPIK